MLVPFLSAIAMLGAIGASSAAVETSSKPSSNIKPFRVDLSSRVAYMLDKVNRTQLPETEEYPGVGATKGMSLEVFKSLKDGWLHRFDWAKEEAYLNSFQHYTTILEGFTIHFVHHKSKDKNSIPIILNHGWPGSFMEFLPVIEQLTTTSKTSKGKPVSFDVVVPSLPGFDFSSKPGANWTLEATGRLFNKLMTDVLGYKKYAVHGTSNGAILAWSMMDSFNKTVRAGHFPLMPFYSTTGDELEDRRITISPLEEFIHERSMEWTNNGTGYFLEHIYKPNTIGLGFWDSPMGQLAWMGEKWLAWADPDAGKAPSLLTHNVILRSISLAFMTETFMSGIYTYAQDPSLPYLQWIVDRVHNDAPLFVTFFKYSIGFWPEQVLRIMGNLVQYRLHETGGFFAGLENPPALVADLRDIADHWSP